MTPVYEVRTKHTKQMLKDFLIFREKAWNINNDFRFIMLTICALTLAVVGKDEPVLLWISLGLAAFIAGLGIIRRPLGVYKLSKADLAYQRQSELYFVFGEKEFRMENSDAPEENARMKYGEVAFMYADEKYFYINVNNEDLHMIPKGDFVQGTPEEFYDFFMEKTGKDFQMVKIPWRMKLSVLRQAWTVAREETEEQKRKNRKNR